MDVVVVGGGLSGLQAAHDIQRAGYSCVILEARDRVGGKTWSQPTKGGSVVDVGAAWINDSNQSRMFALAKRYDLELIEQNTNGNCAAHVPEMKALVFRYGEVPAVRPGHFIVSMTRMLIRQSGMTKMLPTLSRFETILRSFVILSISKIHGVDHTMM